MGNQYSVSVKSRGLTVKACTGDCCVMLAFDLDPGLTDRLAGFSIARRQSAKDPWVYLGNRLNFEGNYTNRNVSLNGKFFPSDAAPFQKFWWIDFPHESELTTLDYQVTVKRFKSEQSTELEADQQVELTIDVGPFVSGKIEVAFTRGYLSSQAYADEFNNASFTPATQQGDWRADTQPFQKQWSWLGGHARQTIIDFFNDCRNTPGATLDAFVYDLNEPDIIEALIYLAPTLRILADNAPLHGDSTAAAKAFNDIVGAGASGLRGHFARYQHNKILIKKVNGVAQKVLTGSTNFSITGLYVNANHVVVFDDPTIAGQYAQDFDLAFKVQLKESGFVSDPISQKEIPFKLTGMPQVVVSYAPHKKPTFSLDTLLKKVQAAKSSVIFAVMDLDGKGALLNALQNLHNDKHIFSYGISDTPPSNNPPANGTAVYSPANKGGELIYSKEDPANFPAPFRNELEVTGAARHIIHHKFVVVDFNGAAPVVFCGSSNLSEGGEESNGDNLIAIYDEAIATAFAIEGIRLVDHYAFAAALKRSSDANQSLSLKNDAGKWWAPYYDDNSIRSTERKLFAG